MQFMRIMKVIMTYDYWIYRPSLAGNPCKRYQIIYASAHSCSCTCMQKWICMECPHTSHVECSQFLNSQHAWVCWDMVARMRSTLMRARSFLRPLLPSALRRLHGCQSHSFRNSQTDSQMSSFPDQMMGQLVYIMASKLPSQPSSPPIYDIYYMNLSWM